MSLNRYTYAHNNPLRFIDPSGHSSEEVDRIIQQIDEARETWRHEEEGAGRNSSAWTQTQKDAHERANALRAQLAKLERTQQVENIVKQEGQTDAKDWAEYKKDHYTNQVSSKASSGQTITPKDLYEKAKAQAEYEVYRSRSDQQVARNGDYDIIYDNLEDRLGADVYVTEDNTIIFKDTGKVWNYVGGTQHERSADQQQRVSANGVNNFDLTYGERQLLSVWDYNGLREYNRYDFWTDELFFSDNWTQDMGRVSIALDRIRSEIQNNGDMALNLLDYEKVENRRKMLAMQRAINARMTGEYGSSLNTLDRLADIRTMYDLEETHEQVNVNDLNAMLANIAWKQERYEKHPILKVIGDAIETSGLAETMYYGPLMVATGYMGVTSTSNTVQAWKPRYTNTQGVGQGVHIKAPSLPEGSQWERNVLNSFAGGKSELKTYGGGTKLYRIGDRNGGFWSLTPPPATEFEWRVNTAIKQEWGNNASNLYEITIPKGSSISGLDGMVGPQGMGLYGGSHQIYIDFKAVPESWIKTTPLK